MDLIPFSNKYNQIVEVLIQCMTDPVNIALSLVMLTFGLLSVFKLLHYKNHIVGEINDYLKSTKEKKRDSSKQNNCHRENKEFFENKNHLKHLWIEFSETIIEWENLNTEEYEYYHSESASKYFNIETTTGANKAFSKIDSAPSILTGLGICGTFIGILLGLNTGFADGVLNTELFITSIQTAFFTSLVGITLSIVFGSWLRSLGNSINDKMSSISNRIDKLYPHFKTLNFKKELLANVKNVDNSLQMLNEDLPKNIAASLVNGAGMDQLTDAATKSINKGLEDLIEAIRKTSEVHETLNKHSDTLSSHLEREKNQLSLLVESNQNVITNLNTSLKHTGDRFERLPEVFDQATKSFILASEKVDKTSNLVPELTRNLENIYNISNEKHLRINEEIQKISISVKEVSEKSLQANANTVVSLDRNLDRFDNTLAQAIQKLVETVKELNDLATIHVSNKDDEDIAA
jgi:hypothetical protein